MATIAIVDDGFRVLGGREAYFRWSSITEISAYKVDFGTYDTICLRIRTGGESAEYFELQEDWIGFKECAAEIEGRFNIRRDWWSLVAFPAFQENFLVLWPASPTNQGIG